MISGDPRLPYVEAKSDTSVSVSWMRRFYERFYALWRELYDYTAKRPFTPRQPYNVVWTATAGTAPNIGNGTLSADYTIRDGFCRVWIGLVGGSTTTWGDAGSWRFSLPQAASATDVGRGRIVDFGTNVYSAIPAVDVAASSTVMAISTHNSASSVTFNKPHTWATNDSMYLELEYPI